MRTRLVSLLVALFVALAAPAAHGASSQIAGPAVPNLSSGFTPQGMAYWTRAGENMIVLAEYKPGANSRLVALSPATGKVYGQVSIAETHAGGVAIVGQWLYVQNAATTGSDAIRAYRLSDFTAAMAKSHEAKGHPVYVKAAHVQQLDAWQWASLMTADGGQLLAGHHGVREGARMYRYDVDQATGHVTATGYVMIPENAQGVAMLAGVPVFTSGGGHLTVGPVSISIPSHAEGIVIVKGTAWIVFENGAKTMLKIGL